MTRVLWLGWEDVYTPRRMQEAARELGISLDTLQITDLEFRVTPEGSCVCSGNTDIAEFYDVLMARTFHPFISEALTVARLFATAGKPVIDASLVDEGYAVSKMHDYLLMSLNGLPVPRTYQLYTEQAIQLCLNELHYPVVLKGVHGSHGTHVFMANNREEVYQRLSTYPAGALMIQEYLPAKEDYRVMVIGYRALPVCVSRSPESGDFRTNVGSSPHASSKRTTDMPGLVDLAEKASRSLRRECAGVDIRYHDGKPYVLEVNRRPVFENFESITGLDVASTLLRYIVEIIRSHQRAG